MEIVEQVRTIQLLTREEHFEHRYSEKLNIACELHKKSGLYEGFLYSATSAFMYFSDMACYGLGIALIYNGRLTPTEVFT